MGTQQLIMIVVAVAIAVAIGMVKQKNIQHKKKNLDAFLFEARNILYEHFMLPVSHGGFGKNVPYIAYSLNNVYALLPSSDATLQSMLYMRSGFSNNGFHIKIWPNYWRKFAIGVRSINYNFERWLLVHCSSGKMEIKSGYPASSDFTTR